MRGEELNWNDFPSDDFACRHFGPEPFVAVEAGGWDGYVAESAQATITMQFAPHPGFGEILFQDLGYAYGRELADALEGQGVDVDFYSQHELVHWQVDGWVGAHRVYGFIMEPWQGCRPLILGIASADEAFVLRWKPTVDEMLRSLTFTTDPGVC